MKSTSSLLLLALTVGCTGDGCDVAPVSGLVTVNGQPIEGVTVKMFPMAAEGHKNVAGTMASGTTDAQGRYSLTLAGKGRRPGATVGTNRVVLSTLVAERNPDDPAGPYRIVVPEKMPEKITSLRHTTLRFEVPIGGTDQANFDL